MHLENTDRAEVLAAVCVSILGGVVSIKSPCSVPSRRALPPVSAEPSLQEQVSGCELCYCYANPFFFPKSLSPIFVFASCGRSPASSSLTRQQFTSAHHVASSRWDPSCPHLFHVNQGLWRCVRALEKHRGAATLRAGSKNPRAVWSVQLWLLGWWQWQHRREPPKSLTCLLRASYV